MSINFKELANKYGTPYYVYDFNHISNQYEELKVLLELENHLLHMQLKQIQIYQLLNI